MKSNETVETEKSIDTFLVGYIGDESKRPLHYEKPLETPLYSKRPRRTVAPGSPSAVTASHPNPTATSTTLQTNLNYGSEEESDSEDENDQNICSVFLPRVQRLHLENLEEKNVGNTISTQRVKPADSSCLEIDRWPTDFVVFTDNLDEASQSAEEAVCLEPSDWPTNSTTLSSIICQLSTFQFEWKEFPNPPLAPTVRKEVFSNLCGPTTEFPTPYDAFTAIWNRDIMEQIAIETNKYAQQLAEKKYNEGTLLPTSRITQWRDTNVDELYVYFALILATGMCAKSTTPEYFTKEDCMSTPQFREYMTLNRFFLLNKCLHFVSNDTDIQNLSSAEAKLHKIAPILSHLNQKFQSLYQLGRNIVIDESLTQWKRRLNIKQYMRKNVSSVGIETLEVCEPQTGYLWRFKVYAEKCNETDNEIVTKSGDISPLVLELIAGLENKGHSVWLDHHYNSPGLARVLKTLGFDCVGTLNTSCQNIPSQIASLNKSDMAVGQISGCTSGDVDVLVWRDINKVTLLSTYHGPAVHKSKSGKTEPIAVHDYKSCMGAMDKKDYALNFYPIERKCIKVWYKKLFHRLLNVSVLNGYILHKHSSIPDTSRCSKHHEFRKKLIQQLLSKHHVSQHTPRLGINPINMPTFSAEMLNHFPEEFGLVPGTTRNERIRRSCVLCRKRMSTFCPACNVPLCAVKCIRTYHEGR